jgi:hypothetical protein
LEHYEWVTPVSALAELNALGVSKQQHLEGLESGIEHLKEAMSEWFYNKGIECNIEYVEPLVGLMETIQLVLIVPSFLSSSVTTQFERQQWLLAAFDDSDIDLQVEYLSDLLRNIPMGNLSRLDDLQDFCWEWWLANREKIADPMVRQRFLQIHHFKAWRRFEECVELYTGKTIDGDLPQMFGKRDFTPERHMHESRRWLCTVGMMSNYTEHISNVRFAFHPSLIEECQNTNLKEHLQSLKEDPRFYEEQIWEDDVRRLPMIVYNIKNAQGESYVMWFHIDLTSEQDIERIRNTENRNFVPRIYLLKTTEDIRNFSEETLNGLCLHSSVLSLDAYGIKWQAYIFCGLESLEIHPNTGIGGENPFRGYPALFMLDGLPDITNTRESFHRRYPDFKK